MHACSALTRASRCNIPSERKLHYGGDGFKARETIGLCRPFSLCSTTPRSWLLNCVGKCRWLSWRPGENILGQDGHCGDKFHAFGKAADRSEGNQMEKCWFGVNVYTGSATALYRMLLEYIHFLFYETVLKSRPAASDKQEAIEPHLKNDQSDISWNCQITCVMLRFGTC